MSISDFEFAVRTTDQMGWGLTEQDFEFMVELEPEGCFVLFEDMERIGIATSVSFGKVGWFGNLIVNESKRNKGAGSLLVNHALKYLTGKGVETVGLYAYMERVPFYKRLGFESDSEFIVMRGKSFCSPVAASARLAEKQDIDEIISYDQFCFGASRRKLLTPILTDPDNLCYVSGEKKILGYALAKVYRGAAELGPVVCERGHTEIAVDLLKATLNRLEGLVVSMFVPKRQSAILSFLIDSGFRQTFKVERMFYGPPAGKDCIYMAESLERG